MKLIHRIVPPRPKDWVSDPEFDETLYEAEVAVNVTAAVLAVAATAGVVAASAYAIVSVLR